MSEVRTKILDDVGNVNLKQILGAPTPKKEGGGGEL